ncbi:MAG: hypothetical protein AAFY73_10030 [Pseudomonadota bacterium]
MFERNSTQSINDQFAAKPVDDDLQGSPKVRWLVTIATILMLGIASVSLSACDSEGTNTDQTGTPPAADDTTTTQ